jgi:hypothetical protein
MSEMVKFGELWVCCDQPPSTNLVHSDVCISGHCYLMLDNLQDAYQAYQQALYHLSDLKVNSILTSQDYL